MNSSPLSPRDLSFILSTPLPSSSTSVIQWKNILLNKISTQEKEENSLLKKIEIAAFLLNKSQSEDSYFFSRRTASYLLPGQIAAFITDLLHQNSTHPLHLETAQILYTFARDFKRHDSNRSMLWKALSKTDRKFLHQLSLWTEDLKILDKPIGFQWLGDGRIERARTNGESVADFGDGSLFRIQPGSMQGAQTDFPLSKFRGFKIVIASPEQKHPSSVCLLTHEQTLNNKAIGRLNEIFDLQEFEQKIKKDEESILFHNQLFNLFACYRSALCSVLKIPVQLPLAISRRGEWTVWPDQKIKSLKKHSSISLTLLAELHQFFHIENLWHINVFNDSPNVHSLFAICDGHLLIKEILPLPTFLKEDIEKRHTTLLNQLQLDPISKERWDVLEATSRAEQESFATLSQVLKMLLEKKSLCMEDFVSLHPQAMLVMHLIRLIDRTTLSISPSNEVLLQAARKMLSPIMLEEKDPTYDYNRSLQQNGDKLTELIFEGKREFKMMIFLFLIHNFAKKSTTDEFIQSILDSALDKIKEISKELHQTLSPESFLPGTIHDYVMLAFGNEFLEELSEKLQESPTNSENLENQLFLLKHAVIHSDIDIELLNQRLQSTLHEAMIEKYSQIFLTDMQHFITTRLADHLPS